MKRLEFLTYTLAQLPSGTFLFFPSLEDRAAADGKLESATIVAYDHPPYYLGSLLVRTLHVAQEEGEFGSFERGLRQRDLGKEPVVIEYELNSENELSSWVIDRGRPQSYIGQLGPGAPPVPGQRAG